MRFPVRFNQTNNVLPVAFKSNSQRFVADFGNFQTVAIYPDAEVYEGSYTVTPEVTAQTLPTKNKTMTQDLRVRAIPYYDVGNTSGGSTIYIGMEV